MLSKLTFVLIHISLGTSLESCPLLKMEGKKFDNNICKYNTTNIIMYIVGRNPFKKYLKEIDIEGICYKYYDLASIDNKYGLYILLFIMFPYVFHMKWFLETLPYSIRVLLESAVRNCDNFQVTENDVNNILAWEHHQKSDTGIEIAFKPARVILQVKYNFVNDSFILYIVSIFQGFYWSTSRC